MVSPINRQKYFPGGLVVKNPPVNAGNRGLIPDPEESTCHEATKPVFHNYQAGMQQRLKLVGDSCSTTRETTEMRSQSIPTIEYAETGEKPCAATKT